MTDPVAVAAEAALAGGLIVLPTDTVYGVGTRPDRPGATAKVFAAKRRSRDLELPILVDGLEAAARVAVFDERADALARRFWPGPVTLVLPRAAESRGWELGGDAGTVGVRVPRHLLAIAVLHQTGPLAVTSANRSGRPTPATCDEIESELGEAVDVYLCEPTPLAGVASTVIDLAHGEPRVLRTGAVSHADIAAVLAER